MSSVQGTENVSVLATSPWHHQPMTGPTDGIREVLTRAGVTAREAEVFTAVTERLTNPEIAERLYISVRTVESHVSALLRKLAAADRAELVRMGAQLA